MNRRGVTPESRPGTAIRARSGLAAAAGGRRFGLLARFGRLAASGGLRGASTTVAAATVPWITPALVAVAFAVAAPAGLAHAASPAGGASDPAPVPLTSPAPVTPMELPGTAGISSAGPNPVSSCADCRSWIVGGKPGARTARIAERHGARRVVPGLGVYRISRTGATGFVRNLGRADRLVYAEPDVPVEAAAYPPDLLDQEQTWLARIVNPAETTPPEVTPGSPLIGLIEQGIDPTHPDLFRADLTGAAPTGEIKLDSHGTSVAGIAGSPGGDGGIRGVWPGARMQHFPAGGYCAAAAKAVTDAVNAGATTLNMSYTMPQCYTHYLATQYAVSRGVLPVAAAGNNGSNGNAVTWPAADPHVISVAAVGPENLVAPFSSRNEFVDLGAPGQDVFAPVGDAVTVGTGSQIVLHTWAQVNGTSFATPMVTAAAAWIHQVRPGLSAAQVGRLLMASAKDLGDPGRDPLYGNGLLDLDSALIAPNPVDDPLEPNDDIPLLKGVGEIPAARYLWKPGGRRIARLKATLSRAKDPADVYRVRIPARKRILVTVGQLEGDVAVVALKPGTRSLSRIGKKSVIVKSDRPYPRTEGILVKNLRRKRQDIWLTITPSPRDRADYAVYRLKIKRSR